MSQKILLLLVCLLSWGYFINTDLQATLSRKYALGHDVYRRGVYIGDTPLVTNELLMPGTYLRDDTDPFYFPSTMIRYSNNMIVELKDNGRALAATAQGQPYAGAFVNLAPITKGKGHTLGFFFNRVENITPFPKGMPPNTFLPAGKPIDVFFGMPFDKIRTGVHLFYASANSEDEARELERKTSLLDLTLGADMKTGPGRLELALMLKSLMGKAEVEDEGKKATLTDGIGFGVRSRYFYPLSSTLALVPHVLYFQQSPKFEDETGGKGKEVEVNGKKTAFAAGLGTVLKTNGSLLHGGFQYFNEGSTIEVKDAKNDTEFSASVIHFNAGVEHDIYEWLGVILGMQYELSGSQKKEVEKEVEVNRGATTPANFFSAGLKFALGNLRLDTVISETLLYTGPFVVTGRASNFNAMLSVSYKF